MSQLFRIPKKWGTQGVIYFFHFSGIVKILQIVPHIGCLLCRGTALWYCRKYINVRCLLEHCVPLKVRGVRTLVFSPASYLLKACYFWSLYSLSKLGGKTLHITMCMGTLRNGSFLGKSVNKLRITMVLPFTKSPLKGHQQVPTADSHSGCVVGIHWNPKILP